MLDILERERERDIYNKENIEELNENEIVILAKNDNEQAIRILINRYRNLFIKIISKYYVMNYDKEDLLSECLISLYIAIRDYEADNKLPFKSFLYYVIKKRIFTLIRNNNRQKRKVEDFINLENINLVANDKVLEKIENKELIERVKDKLSNLELKVLNLYLENYSYNEIENLLNVSKKSIDNCLKRIKIKIKEVISNV
jgi:RNA polymerase sigma factor (sigma-70 family)